MNRDETLKVICRRLSMQCRFGGDVRRFYSVAEHTVHMVRQARHQDAPPRVQLLLWLHDTPEHITGDLLPIIKTDSAIAEAFEPIEYRAMNSVCEALGVPVETGHRALTSPVVKCYDKAILAAEAEFIANPQPDWKPFDADNPLHVAFGVRLQRSTPLGHRFEYLSRLMQREFDRIMGEL